MTPMLIALATDVDDLTIAFNESSLTLLKIVIGLILFGIALDTTFEDFAAALRRPGVIAIGVIAQFAGYVPVFGLAIAFQIVALAVLVGIVKEPRTARLAAV